MRASYDLGLDASDGDEFPGFLHTWSIVFAKARLTASRFPPVRALDGVLSWLHEGWTLIQR
jgi:hypothetical protein